MEVALVVAVIVVIFVARTFKIVPQQNAWVVERLGKFDRTLTPGLKFVIPFVERVAYKHSLKEVPLDVPSQVCITKDNTQLQVDGIIYFQVTDPMRASYGSSNYVLAITQLAQTLLRSVIGKMELDKTFEERDQINAAVVSALDERHQELESRGERAVVLAEALHHPRVLLRHDLERQVDEDDGDDRQDECEFHVDDSSASTLVAVGRRARRQHQPVPLDGDDLVLADRRGRFARQPRGPGGAAVGDARSAVGGPLRHVHARADV